MAVQDLWFTAGRKETSRHGRGKRWRVNVPGHPTRAFFRCRDAAQRVTVAFGDRFAADIGRADIQAWVSGLTVTVKGGDTACVAHHPLQRETAQR